MVKCPNCQATLPDGAFQCQFCRTQLALPPGAARGYGRPSRQSAAMPGSPSWVMPAYYGIALWWMFSGVWDILHATLWAGKDSGGFLDILGIVFGGITALVGLGLLLRIDVVRGIVNVLCFLQILFGILGLITSFLLSGPFGMIGVLGMIHSIVDIGTAALMIYLIGETDTRAPNF